MAVVLVTDEPTGVPNGNFPLKLVVTELDGSEPDLDKIVESESWAHGLIEVDCFALDAEGGLLLTDRCGGYRCPPLGRFLMHVEIGADDFLGNAAGAPSVDDPPFDTLNDAGS